ncbi:MAG: NAD-dependent epimerase/dehydratase family protein [Lachnospiraceae bacterium]|nr:NAD-dependent epimerase/dehydratase family protein [Lachnospiraceae bacterium]
MELYRQELRKLNNHLLPWEKLSGKTIMISGATGMLGKCLIDFLMLKNATENAKIQIIALSRNDVRAKERFADYWDSELFQYISCDVNKSIPECGQVDYIIHAASNTHPLQYSQDSIGTITSNVIGTKNMLDYAVAHGTQRFCFASSVEIYGENRGDVEKFDEKYLGYIDCNTLRAGYPESKRLGETLCNAYGQTYGLDFVIPRLSRVYGPTMLSSDSKAISQFIRKAAVGEDIVLKSEGNQRYSYTFVIDAVAGILYCLLLGEAGEAYNVADEKSDISLKDLAEYLAQIVGKQVIFELPDEKERRGYSTATKAMLDAGKLESLGWRPRVHIAEGLQCTVEEILRMKI